jgi:uncharacterized protein YuzE
MAITSINIQSYLNLAKMIHDLPKQDFWTAYDAVTDVFYISFYQPSLPTDDSELTDNDVIIRYQGDKIFGLSILNVSKIEYCK